ncbi:DNA polymerase III subunit chi, partial [Pseudomonas aeruginosa]
DSAPQTAAHRRRRLHPRLGRLLGQRNG